MKKLIMCLCVGAAAGMMTPAARADSAEAGSILPSNLASSKFGMAFDSKFMSYGLVDNNDPIVTPSAEITLAEFLTVGVEALFDTTKYGKKHGGYSNRGGKYIELDPYVALGHTLSPDDVAWLPTTVEWSIGYSYEYHPETMGHSRARGDGGAPTQFVTAEITLPDIPLEPHVSVERDILRDNGTYGNLEIGHTFSLIDGANADAGPLLGLRLTAAQGVGNAPRVKGYLSKRDGAALDHAGMMDTCLKAELAWRICDHVTLSGYIAYDDFLFDREIRAAARRYEASGRHDTSWTFTTGLALSVEF